MSDWQVGDLALCVNAARRKCNCGGGHIHNGSSCPPMGTLRIVLKVLPFNEGWAGEICEEPVLLFDESGVEGGLVSRFIKVTPPEADEFDRETIEMETTRPVRVTTGMTA